MAKWYGKVGYITTVETEPGLWEPQPVERPYFGDVIRNTSRWVPSNNINDNLTTNNQISIVSDPYAIQKFHEIKYVEFMGTFWEVSSADVQYPRIILTLGEVYNGDTVRVADET